MHKHNTDKTKFQMSAAAGPDQPKVATPYTSWSLSSTGPRTPWGRRRQKTFPTSQLSPPRPTGRRRSSRASPVIKRTACFPSSLCQRRRTNNSRRQSCAGRSWVVRPPSARSLLVVRRQPYVVLKQCRTTAVVARVWPWVIPACLWQSPPPC